MYDRLKKLGYMPCIPLDMRERLSLKEERTTYVLKCAKKAPITCFKVDGYIITEGRKCDYMILVQDILVPNLFMQILVELKGTDVAHAISQLESSLTNHLLQHNSINSRKARIVAQSFPSSKSNPIIANAKRNFLTKYKCELKTVKTNQPDII